MSDIRPLGRIITFYSYKGGTGRSMALANIAWMLASAGRRVLAIDWDLEAPGLHRYFRPFLIDDELTASEGLMDLVDNYANEAIRPLQENEKADPHWYVPFADFSNYIVSINFPHFRSGGKIDFLPAGRQGDHYALAVSSFNWQNFYDRLGGGGFIEAVKQRARSAYDYVLIDSRTGVSDTAGICSVQMPDTLVVCFTYNNQSIKGASAVAHSALAMHDKLVQDNLTLRRTSRTQELSTGLVDTLRPYRIFPVAMRVDSGESDRLVSRQAFAQRAFADLLGHIGSDIGEYWKSVEVPHTSFYSYEEVLAPFKDDPQDPKTVLAALLRLTRYVTDRDVSDFLLPISPADRQKFLDAFAETQLTAAGRKALSDSQRETEDQIAVRLAEAALAEMSDAQRVVARRVLTRLVRVGRDEDGGGYYPIRTNLRDFNDEERQVIAQLASHRVITTGGEDGFVAFADARLINSWRTLTDWIAQDREFLTWRQQLRTYLNDWERSGRDRGALLSGRLLNEADLLALRRQDDLTASEREYIAASRAVNLASPRVASAEAAAPVPAAVPSIAQPEWTSNAPSTAVPHDPNPAARTHTTSLRLAWGAAAVLLVILVGGWISFRQMTSTSPPDAGQTAVDPPVPVPRLIGLQSAAAQIAVQTLGLKVLMSDGINTDVPYVDGIVTAQTPGEEATIAKDGVIRLTISALTAVTPTVVGMSLTDTLRILEKERLKLGKTESRYVPDSVVGRVIDQQPSAGTRVAAGTDVNVVVARAAQLADFRIGIYFVKDDSASNALAQRLVDSLRRGGYNVTSAPRGAEFFTSRVMPAAHEIRYGSPAERQVAEELQLLLQKAGDFPAFAPRLVRNSSTGFISIFLMPQREPAYSQQQQKAPPSLAK